MPMNPEIQAVLDGESDGVIITGDCMEVMADMPDGCVDSIVTDPPYGLKFMGKRWDYGVPSVEVWTEAMRVLKPGGYLLAFGGTRTYHRLVCAIEDAGFEIRDTITWNFGSGFPKSRNIGCKCGGGTVAYSHDKNQVDNGDVQDVRQAVSKTGLLGEADREPLLQLQLQRQAEGEGAPAILCEREGEKAATKGTARSQESSMEGRSDVLAETRQLQANQVCPVSGGVLADGSQGRLHHGAPADNGQNDGSRSDAARSGTSQESRPARQQPGQSGTIREQSGTQEGGRTKGQVCPQCGGLIGWKGYGTALKPAMELICLARKPLSEKTVAANVLKWGTGALNIDGCRVGNENTIVSRREVGARMGANGVYGESAGRKDTGSASGRWPANVIHDGSEEVLEGFPETTQNGYRKNPSTNNTTWFGAKDGSHIEGERGFDDSGSAARFFYCAKASRAERTCGGKVDNQHPTVKPQKLMRYLCRLITPPGGTVLDLFLGSGSTAIAAKAEGFGCVGIERDSDSAEVARQRVANIKPEQAELFAEKP